MNLPEIEERFREIVAAIPPPFRRAMLEVPTAPDAADRGTPDRRGGGPYLRAVLVGMLREGDRET